MSFGRNLFEMRKRRGLSQEELADAIKVTRQTIYTWESDSVSPSIENLKALAGFFECSTDDLINEVKPVYVESTGKEQPKILTCHGDKNEISKRIHIFSNIIAGATMLILFGVATLVFGGNTTNDAEMIPYFIAFWASLIIAVAMFIYGSISYGTFIEQEENKNYKILFTNDEKKKYTKYFAAAIASATVLILLGVLFIVVTYIVPENDILVWPVATFLYLIGISSFIFIKAGIEYSKYDKEDIEMDTESKNKIEKIDSVLWLVIVAIYLVLGFVWNLWHPGWVIFVVGGFLSGIISTIFSKPNK